LFNFVIGWRNFDEILIAVSLPPLGLNVEGNAGRVVREAGVVLSNLFNSTAFALVSRKIEEKLVA
jgi:hypothetical protein